ncbi:putative alpha/beta-hydrolase family hydrolase [Halarchaeum rubridurum]|uniref:Putative alpha/beta-hydrolase family hydrolase n=1 Tax=Halarchaeum rubridurum TaxID=489911 RepID=A0A830FMA8_9EURY|nr:hypothetical protein [Halarchaeum rubridurum]MBP1953578.1 putative alpha/beta-hydrolase family hydrolase [Halarchaeum rubridurum]GGM64227.1 hypothetical protein GCM10009017_12840 [Halarchaeum rubridurum]
MTSGDAACRRLATTGVRAARFEVEEPLRAMEARLEAGERPTAEQIHALRNAIDYLITITEDDLAPAATNTEAYTYTYSIPYGAQPRRRD